MSCVGLRTEFPKPSLVDRAFVYLDPPYYSKGSQLYLNHYTADDHTAFASYLATAKFTWIMSYDNVAEIRKLYSSYRQITFNLGYSARECKIGKELLILPRNLRFPSAWRKSIPDQFISSADRIRAVMPTAVADAT